MVGLRELIRALMTFLTGRTNVARNMHVNPRTDPSGYQPTDVEILQPAQMLGLKGEDIMLPVNQLTDTARLVRNLMIRNGAYETRDSVSKVFGDTSNTLFY